MNKIYIHKGDSTIFADVTKFITFVLDTELDLIGWSATFQLANITRVIDDITSKEFEIILTSEETKSLFLGDIYGSLILKDFNGNIKTISNTIPFCVTSKVIENTSETIDLNIPDSTEINISVKVGASTVTSVNGMTGDVVIEMPDVSNFATKEDIPSLDGYVKNTDYASSNKGGVVKTLSSYGISTVSNGFIAINASSQNDILNKTSQNKPIVPLNIDFAVKTGVTTNTIELTEEEKANAKVWLGYADSTDIMQAIASIPQFKLSIVDELPMTGEKMTLYFVPKEGADNDIYNEYVWIEQTGSYEFLGSTAVDLTDYVKKTDYAGDNAGVIKRSNAYGTTLYSGYLVAGESSLEQYTTRQNSYFIGKGTLENVLTQYPTNEIVGDIEEILDTINGGNSLLTTKALSISQADYDTLTTKDPNTLYLIEE